MVNHDAQPEQPSTTVDPRVESLLSAAAAPPEPGPLPGEEAALACFRDLCQEPADPAFPAPRHRLERRPTPLRPARVLTAAAVGAGVLMAGGVAAAAGVLPGQAQDHARTWLDKVGVSVPSAEGRTSGQAGRGDAAADERETPAGPVVLPPRIPPDHAVHADGADRRGAAVVGLPLEAGKGVRVSDLARDLDGAVTDKGARLSELASEGRSELGRRHAGQGLDPAERRPAQEGAGSTGDSARDAAEDQGEGNEDPGAGSDGSR